MQILLHIFELFLENEKFNANSHLRLSRNKMLRNFLVLLSTIELHRCSVAEKNCMFIFSDVRNQGMEIDSILECWPFFSVRVGSCKLLRDEPKGFSKVGKITENAHYNHWKFPTFNLDRGLMRKRVIYVKFWKIFITLLNEDNLFSLSVNFFRKWHSEVEIPYFFPAF